MAVLNAQGLPVQLLLQPDRNFLDLAAGLAPGMTLRGRVTEVLADGKAIVSFRGINVTADLRNVTLAKGEVITVSVQDLGGTPTFRLVPQTSVGVGLAGGIRTISALPATQVEATLDRLGLPRDGFHAAVVRLLDAYGVPPTRESAVAVKDLAGRLPALFARATAPAASLPVASASVPLWSRLDAWAGATASAGTASAPPAGWAPQYAPATPFLAAIAGITTDPASFSFGWQPVADLAGMSLPPAAGSPAPSRPAGPVPVPAVPVTSAPPPTPVIVRNAPEFAWNSPSPVPPAPGGIAPAPSLETALGASRGYLLGRIAAALAWELSSGPVAPSFGGFEPMTWPTASPVAGEYVAPSRLTGTVAAGSGPAVLPVQEAAVRQSWSVPTPPAVPSVPVQRAPVALPAAAPASSPPAAASPESVVSGAQPFPAVRLSATLETVVRAADALLVRMPESPAIRELAQVVADLHTAFSQPRPPTPAAGPAVPSVRTALAPIVARLAAVVGRLESSGVVIMDSAPAVPGAPIATAPALPRPVTTGGVVFRPEVPAGATPLPEAPAGFQPAATPIRLAAAELAGLATGILHEAVAREQSGVMAIPADGTLPARSAAALPPAVARPDADASAAMPEPVAATPLPARPAVAVDAGLRLPLPAVDVMRVLTVLSRDPAVSSPAEPVAGAQVPPLPATPAGVPSVDRSETVAIVRGAVPELRVALDGGGPVLPGGMAAPSTGSGPDLPAAPLPGGGAVPAVPVPMPAPRLAAGPAAPAMPTGPAVPDRPFIATPSSSPLPGAPAVVSPPASAVTAGPTMVAPPASQPAPVPQGVPAAPIGGAAAIMPVDPAIPAVVSGSFPAPAPVVAPVADASAGRLVPVSIEPVAARPVVMPSPGALVSPTVVPATGAEAPGAAPTVPVAAQVPVGVLVRPDPVSPRTALAPPTVADPAPSPPVPLGRFLAGLAAEIRRQDVPPAPERLPASGPVAPARPSPSTEAPGPVRTVPVQSQPAAVSGGQPPATPALVAAPPAAEAPPLPVSPTPGSPPPPPVAAPVNGGAARMPVSVAASVPAAPPVPSSMPAAVAPPPPPPAGSLPVMSMPVLETAVFMHARGLPATPATAAAAHEFLFAAPRLPAALDRFEVAVAAAQSAPRPEPLRVAVDRMTGLVRAIRVTPDTPQFAQHLRAAVERMGLTHEAGLARAADTAGVGRAVESASSGPPDRANAPAASGLERVVAPADSRTRPEVAGKTTTPVQPHAADRTPDRTDRPGVAPDARPATDAARPLPAHQAPATTGQPVREARRGADEPAPALFRETLPPPVAAPRATEEEMAPLRETIKAAALEVRREATEALRHAQTPVQRQQLIALRDAAHEIIQSVNAQQLGSWTGSDATSVVQVQIPLALGAEIRGGDIRVSWREEKQSKKRDPKIPSQMTMEIDTRSLGPVGVHLEMLGNALSLIFRVYDEGVQAFVRDELPDLVNKLAGYDYRVTRAECEVEAPEPAPATPLPTRAAPTTSLDLTA